MAHEPPSDPIQLQKLKDDYETKRQEYLEELNRKELSLVEAREEESDLRIANLEREIEPFLALYHPMLSTPI